MIVVIGVVYLKGLPYLVYFHHIIFFIERRIERLHLEGKQVSDMHIL